MKDMIVYVYIDSLCLYMIVYIFMKDMIVYVFEKHVLTKLGAQCWTKYRFLDSLYFCLGLQTTVENVLYPKEEKSFAPRG